VHQVNQALGSFTRVSAVKVARPVGRVLGQAQTRSGLRAGGIGRLWAAAHENQSMRAGAGGGKESKKKEKQSGPSGPS
jgi:hypothetical protein